VTGLWITGAKVLLNSTQEQRGARRNLMGGWEDYVHGLLSLPFMCHQHHGFCSFEVRTTSLITSSFCLKTESRYCHPLFLRVAEPTGVLSSLAPWQDTHLLLSTVGHCAEEVLVFLLIRVCHLQGITPSWVLAEPPLLKSSLGEIGRKQSDDKKPD
jgi:hypothetical protein